MRVSRYEGLTAFCVWTELEYSSQQEARRVEWGVVSGVKEMASVGERTVQTTVTVSALDAMGFSQVSVVSRPVEGPKLQ